MPKDTRRKLSIYVIGPSSTGKTTLCDILAQKLGISQYAYVTEVARRVMKDKGYSRDTIGSVQMQQDIMDEHFHREEELDVMDEPIRIFDRSALDPIVYAILTSKTREQADTRKSFLMDSDKFQKLLQKYRSPESVVILLGPVPEWLVDDGIRSLESQTECFAVFKDLLSSLKVNYRQFGGESKFLYERVVLTLGFGKF